MGAIHMLAAADLVGGGYVNIWKIIPAILLLLLWAKLLAWADKDAVAAHLPRIPLNAGMLGSMVLSYFFFFLLPYYFVTLPLLVVVFGANIGTYAAIRHKKV